MEKYRYTEPIKMPRGAHYGSSYLVLPSKKIGRNVTAFSNLEFENLLTLEMDHKVEYYCEQPLRVETHIGGKKRETTFDVWVMYADGKNELQEVKYEEELNSQTTNGERCREQVAIQKMWCLQNEYEYCLRTDRDIELGPFWIRNLSYLAAKARRFQIPDKDAERIIVHYLQNIDRSTIGLLDSSGRFERFRTMDYLAYLYYKGVIDFVGIADNILSFKTEVVYCGK